MHRPMRRAFAGNYLDRGMSPPRDLPTQVEVAAFLMEAALDDLGGVPLTPTTPGGDERIARMMAAEAVAALNRSGGKNSANWYTDSIDEAVGVAALMHPELGSDAAAVALGRGLSCAEDARCVFFCALAIASQNNTVPETVRYAEEQYAHYVEHGRFLPKVYGQKGASIAGNLARFNQILEVAGGDVTHLREFLCATFTMRQFREAAASVGIRVGGREMQDEVVHGSMMFGPKIGNAFFQNLMGNHSRSTLTIDLWFMRTWGRYTGTLVKGRVSPAQVERLAEGLRSAPDDVREALVGAGVDPDADYAAMAPDEIVDACRPLASLWEGFRKGMLLEGLDNAGVSERKAAMGWPGAAEAVMKGLARSVDQPERAGDRRWMRAVTGRALDILATRGYRMSAADLQATLWYPERSLWAALSGRKAEHANVSFDEALADVARRKGHDDDAIERARIAGPGYRTGPFARRGAAVVEHGPGGRGDPGPPRRRPAGGGEGDGGGPDGEDARAGRRHDEEVTEDAAPPTP